MLNRLATPLREFGCWAGLIYVVGRSLQALSPRLNLYLYELMVQPIPDTALVPERVSRNVEIRRIERGDPAVALMPARPDVKESRYDQGAICLGAFREGQFIGYIWLAFGRYDEDEVRCTYVLTPRGEAVFDFDLYIFPEYRMGRAFVGIWSGVNDFLHERGIRWTFSRITRFNLASRSAHARLGGRIIGRALFLQAWRLEIMVATVRPYASVLMSSRRRVALALDAGAEPVTSAVQPVPGGSGRRADWR